MARSYSDPSYGSKKELRLNPSGALNSTESAATEIGRHTFMQPVTVTDGNIWFNAGGTNTDISVVFGKSAAGTGSVSAMGTAAIGTSATGSVKDGSLTSTDFSSGDDLVVQRAAGTSTTSEDVVPSIQYTERFVESDS